MASLSGFSYKYTYGGSNGDWLTGSSLHHDVIFGNAGNDFIFGYNGNDYLYGGTGNDYLSGSSGNDYLIGGTGDDRLYGGTGNDTFVGEAGADRMYGGSGADLVSYATSSAAVNVDLNAGVGYWGDSQGDTFHSIENVTGSNYNDVIVGSGAANVLDGRNGSDNVFGGAGNDTLRGGSGVDYLYGGDHDDVIDGGNDTDYVYGGNGSDTVTGGAGNDWLFGDAGYDTFIGGQGSDAHYGGSGTDIVTYASSDEAVNVSLTNGRGNGGDAEGDTYNGIENFVGSNFGDTISGSVEDNELYGGGGGDNLHGSLGDDTLYGGDGGDRFYGGHGADDIYGGTGEDSIYFFDSPEDLVIDLSTGTGHGGSAEGDTYHSIERVFGSFYDDTIIGDAGDNFLSGGYGNDTLIGGLGNDILLGGAVYGYSDTFVFGDTRGPEADIITDFRAGSDKIDFTATEFSGFNDLTNGGNRYMEQVGNDTVIHYYDHTITLKNVDEDNLNADDFLFA